MGILERGGKVRATVVPNGAERLHCKRTVRKHVTAGLGVYSMSSSSLTTDWTVDYVHQVVDHATQYVDGRVHTNGIENFWSLLKRGISGTYVAVEPFHLFRYVDEQDVPFQQSQDLMTLAASI